MAPNSPSRRIVRLGVAVVIALVIFLYFTPKFNNYSVVQLLRSHTVTPGASSPLDQDELRDVQPAEGPVKRGLDNLPTWNDVIPGISSSRRAAGGSVLAGIALAGPLPADVLSLEQQPSALSPSTIASVGSPESVPVSGFSSTPTARPPEGTVAGRLWTGGGNKPLPTGSPAAMANPGALVPPVTVSFTTTVGAQGSEIITATNTVYMAGITSTSTISINLPCSAPSPCSTGPQTCNCPLETSRSQCNCPLQSNQPETCNCPIQSCITQPTASLDYQETGSEACPHIGYTCDDCIDGWFCPPPQTPAQTGPNGCFGWVCADCSSGWFCVPQPTDTSSATSSTISASSSPAAALPLLRRPVTSVMTQSAAPKPTIQNDASGWAYAGCWADQPHQPVLAWGPGVNLRQPLTNEICVRHCLVAGYTLAATSFGNRCLCGQFLNGTKKLDDEAKCSTPCASDETRVCGGDWALSCYSPDGQARGWAQIGEQASPGVLDPPTVLSLGVRSVEATVVTVANNVFPTPGVDLGQLVSQYGQSTQQPKIVLSIGVGWDQGGPYIPAPSCHNGDSSLSSLTPTPSGGESESCLTPPTTTNENTSPYAITGLNQQYSDPLNGGRSSDCLTVSGVELNPTITLIPEGSGEALSYNGFPAPSATSPALASETTGQSDTIIPTSGPGDSSPTGNAYEWPSGARPYGEGLLATTRA